jgi:hypothetical protein
VPIRIRAQRKLEKQRRFRPGGRQRQRAEGFRFGEWRRGFDVDRGFRYLHPIRSAQGFFRILGGIRFAEGVQFRIVWRVGFAAGVLFGIARRVEFAQGICFECSSKLGAPYP